MEADKEASPARPAQVNSTENAKWAEMLEFGLQQYIRTHPEKFHKRIRRGIPPRFRWLAWKQAVGLADREVPDNYHALSIKPNKWTQLIEIDIGRTFPELKSFDATQQQRLLRVLNAYASHNPALGYCQGMNYIAGLLLLVSDNEAESFAVLVCLMDYPPFALSGFYQERLPLLRRYLRACDWLVAEKVPELREHFIKESVQPAVYLHQWFLTLFINCFPIPMVMVLWDVIICEGLPVILRIAVSILVVLKESLLSMHFEEIIKFFKMMKTYDDEEGELNAFRIGQLLMKHTEHVQISQRTLEYLAASAPDDDTLADSDESWEADLGAGGWWQSLSRIFTFGPVKRRSHGPRATSAPDLTSGAAAPPTRTQQLQQPHLAYQASAPLPTSSGGLDTHRSSPRPAGVADGSPEEDALVRGWEFL